MKVTADLNAKDVDQLDELIEFLENVRANIHLPVREGTHGGSVSLDERGSTDSLSEATVQGSGSEGDRSSELSTDVGPVLLGPDVPGPADEGVHDGSEEEESALDKIAALCVIRVRLLENLDALKKMTEQGEKLLVENARLGGLAVKELVEANDAG